MATPCEEQLKEQLQKGIEDNLKKIAASMTQMKMNMVCFSMPYKEPLRRSDCYFYEEVQDMAAHIPTCNYHSQLGYCPCDDCKKYIKKSDVFRLVKDRVDNTKEDKS